jgi:uncharacterized protein (DUF1330 family)
MRTNYKLAVALLAGAAVGALAMQGLHAQTKPAAYSIADIEVIDQDAFKDFAPKAGAVIQAAGGKFLVRGGQVTNVEGDAPKRVVVITFENVDKAQAWQNSAAWKELLPLRAKSQKVRSFIVEGVAN